MNSKRFLVTGCAGFIGSKLTTQLMKLGAEVLGVDSFSDYYDARLKEQNLKNILDTNGSFEFMRCDINSSSFVIPNDIDGIFHLAAQAGVRSSWGSEFTNYVNQNIVSTQKIFENSGRGIPIVYASSSSVYGDSLNFPVSEGDPLQPISPYGVTKLTCEALSFAYSKFHQAKIVGLRYFTVYGPGQRPDMAFTKICRALLTGDEFVVFGTGEQIRDFTFVSDAVDATILLMLEGETGAYNIGGGNQVSLNTALKAFEDVSGRKLNLRYVETTKGDVLRTGASTEKIREATGWSPRVEFQDGIESHWAWAKDNSELLISQINFK